MYLDAFRLTRAPFDAGDVELVYVGPGQMETLATLGAACSEEDTLTLLTAPEGGGKSTLINKFLADLDDNVLWSEVRGRWTDPAEFLRAVVIGFGFEDCSGKHEQLQHILEVFLTHQRRRGTVPVLVVEDAQSLGPKVLEEVRWLAALEVDEHKAINVVLSGLPELERIVCAPAMEVLSSRRRHRLQVKALSQAETAEYIVHRLVKAGATHAENLFTPDAMPIIHRYTGGIPGLVNTLCETALACAAERGVRIVDADSVEAAVSKLHVVYESGETRVQGMRSTDAKAIRQGELARLIVTHDEAPVREYRVTRERVLIGRRPGNDLRLDTRGVSRYHAMMLLDGDGWWLIDMHSRNGTYVNSQRIRQCRISNNDIIQIADYRLRCLHKLLPNPASNKAVPEAETVAASTAEPAGAEAATGGQGRANARPGEPPVLENTARRPGGKRGRPRLVKSN